MILETAVGLTASIITTSALVPQLVKIIKEKKAENVSMMWIVILFAGLACWSFYGFLKKDPIIIVSNLVSLVINASIGVFAFRYKK
jgi:MtN3 and saliva related transmembrane protein